MHDRLFATQYMQNGDIAVEPDSIVVSGPAELLDPLTAINTQTVMLTGLTDSTEVIAELHETEGLTYSQDRVRLIIPVDRFTEVNSSLPVTVINVPGGETLVPFPDRCG
jgi:hypothetical protein